MKKKLTFNNLLIVILSILVIAILIIHPESLVTYFSLGMGIALLIGSILLIKPNGKKKFGDIFGSILIGIMMIPMSIFIIYSAIGDNVNNLLGIETTTEADGFTIEAYGVQLDVGIDNKVDVTEIIYVNFYEDGHHGIYKFTPKWLKYTGKDGNTIRRKSEILNYRAVNDNYKVENTNGKPKIRIGSEDKTVSGLQEYMIQYTYDMGKDPFNGFDEFIFHAFGDYWGTEIKNPTIVVNMPKEIDDANINVFTDKYRKNNVNELVEIEREENSFRITSNNLNLMKSLTVDIDLPDNYFVGGSNNYGWNSFAISMVIIAVTIYIAYMWSKYGKDEEKQVPTVEFNAPDNLNPAEIGYVYNNGRTNKKLTVALIIRLASKGCIKINEIKDSKGKTKDIQITNLYPGMKSTIDNEPQLFSESKSQFVIKRLESNKELTSIEQGVYTRLFNDNSYVKIVDSDDSEFIEVKDSLINKGYIEIIKDSVNAVKSIDEVTKEKLLFPELDDMERNVYDTLFSLKDDIILSEHTTLYTTFSHTDKLLKDEFNKNVYDVESQEKKKITIIIASLLFLLSCISFFNIEDLNPNISYMYYIAFGCVILDYILAVIMDKKTKYGETISAKVKGFRDFLDTAEKEKLEALVLDNPHYFYDILPYTYVLNLSKKWIEKFHDIKMPETVNSDISYLSSAMLFDTIASDISFPSSSGSGGSSGGCSSCGGGCSSCGGGGSW